MIVLTMMKAASAMAAPVAGFVLAVAALLWPLPLLLLPLLFLPGARPAAANALAMRAAQRRLADAVAETLSGQGRP